MTISVKITRKSNIGLKKKLQKVTSDIHAEAERQTKEAVLALHNSAVKIIQKVSPGHQETRYNEGGKPRTVTVSNPGESPNTDNGILIGSIGTNFFRTPKGPEGRTGTNLLYGKWLELGTKRMKPHPWLSTAWKQNEKGILKDFFVSIKKKIRENGIA